MKAPTTTENANNFPSSTEQLPTTTGNVTSALSAAGQFSRTLANPLVAVTTTAIVALLVIAYVVGKLA